MALDHGVLNIPLAKRGNIDAQIDKYKAEQAKLARAARKAAAAKVAELRPSAKAAVSAMDPDTLARIAGKAGITVTQARKNLMSDAHWRPEWLLGVLSPLGGSR